MERDRKQKKKMFWLIYYLIIFSLWICNASQIYTFHPTLRMKNVLKYYNSHCIKRLLFYHDQSEKILSKFREL